MNAKLLSVLTAAVVALAVSVPASIAKPYTPAQFNAELKKKVGKKTGAAAYNAAATFYRTALTDKANKKNASTYVSSMTAVLKKQVTVSLQAKASQALISALQVGYFTGTAFNLNDAKFSQALVSISKFIPFSSRTTITSQSIYQTMKNYALSKGSTQLTIFDYYKAKLTPFLPVPPIS